MSATGWCSSTSSRTPTPHSGRILRRAFHGHRTLILIGDPKQAIYAFRGADVFSYLEAAGHADQHATLPTNHRSDEAVVRGLADLMGGLELGDPRIVVNPVTAANDRPRLVGLPTDGPGPAAHLAPGGRRAASRRGAASRGRGRRRRRHRGHPDRPRAPDHRASRGRDGRPVAPGDIAVLVSTHNQAAAVRDALVEAGVPVVVASASSVFATPAAEQWLTLLQGDGAAAFRRRSGPPPSPTSSATPPRSSPPRASTWTARSACGCTPGRRSSTRRAWPP